MGAAKELETGQGAYEARAWRDAYDSLSRADEIAPLDVGDLKRLAVAAYMIGLDDEFVRGMERAHGAHLERGEIPSAVRCAFWVGINLATRGEPGLAGGWFARGERLIERAESDCVERGYLLLPAALRNEGAGEWEAAAAIADQAARIAESFDDRDLLALSIHEQGYATAKHGDLEKGMALLDEAMVEVTSGKVSPLVTGLVYCGVIAYCQSLYELQRAQQWTSALTRWCEEQPQMVAYSGQCLVHQAEILQLRGAWGEAIDQARRAGERFTEAADSRPAAHREGSAHYRQAEVQRLRGEFDEAEDSFRAASRCGFEPQPGLALLRLAQGNAEAGAASIRRALDEVTDPLERVGLLPGCVEIMLAVGDREAAAEAAGELERAAEEQDSDVMLAMASQARGAVAVASERYREGLLVLRRSAEIWQQLKAPYETARVRELAGRACRAVGDGDTADLELEAASEAFAWLGAEPDKARIDSLAAADIPPAGLTTRELDVLRLVCSGKTNRAIASELVVSRRTVDRHVSNIFAKLGVTTRAAATAYAYEHDLL